jgi:Putative Ig domain
MVVGGSLTGCGGGASGQSSSAATSINEATGIITRASPAAAPQISGTASTTVTAGQSYVFQPQASGSSGTTLSFTIANKPSWAKFSSKTGQLSGTPAATDVGTYKSIELAVTDGTAVTALPAFSITVAAAPGSSSSTVSLSWVAPTENSDGTLLSNLKGYNVHYGTKSQTYSMVINVPNPGLTDYVVQNLDAGTYYFSVSAYNSTGTESALSGEAAASVN